ncbi:hypothetical protein ABE485_04350 [Achromobacter spanius]|uniref:hypothetical protein n=1 Tax=Achromobacter spanius TaxID=217203 RepID=UPI0032083CDE
MRFRSIGTVLLFTACAVAEGREWIPVASLSSVRMSVSAVENSRRGELAQGVLRTEFHTVQHDSGSGMDYDQIDTELELNCARPIAQPVRTTYYLKGKALSSKKSTAPQFGAGTASVGRMIYQACTVGYTAPVLPPGWILATEDTKQFGSIYAEPASRQGDHAAGRLRMDLRQPDKLDNGQQYDRMEITLRFNCLAPVMEMMEMKRYMGGKFVDEKGRGESTKMPILPDSAALDAQARACAN